MIEEFEITRGRSTGRLRIFHVCAGRAGPRRFLVWRDPTKGKIQCNVCGAQPPQEIMDAALLCGFRTTEYGHLIGPKVSK
jgi:hypothetical protein